MSFDNSKKNLEKKINKYADNRDNLEYRISRSGVNKIISKI